MTREISGLSAVDAEVLTPQHIAKKRVQPEKR